MKPHPLIDQLYYQSITQCITQAAMEDKFGLCRNQINKWETAYCSPNLHNFIAWANALGYDVTLTTGGSIDKTNSPPR